MPITVRGESQKPGIVKDGVYPAKLTAVREFTNSYGPRLGFDFTLGGSAQGQTVTRSTAPKLTAHSHLSDMLRSLTGKDINQTDIERGFDLENLIGTSCQVVVKQARSKNGSTYANVEAVIRD